MDKNTLEMRKQSLLVDNNNNNKIIFHVTHSPDRIVLPPPSKTSECVKVQSFHPSDTHPSKSALLKHGFSGGGGVGKKYSIWKNRWGGDKNPKHTRHI